MSKYDVSKFREVTVALNTPFDAQGELDIEATKRVVRYFCNKGVKSLYVCGSTGEGFLLSTEERKKVVEAVVEAGNLSPLEAAVFAKIKIDNEYIYDPDADNADEWDNINLSQMINHSVNGQKRAVCMGFSTLYSALLSLVT